MPKAKFQISNFKFLIKPRFRGFILKSAMLALLRLAEIPRINARAKAFTLIEFLIVLGLLALTVGSALIFLTSLLKGSNQARILAETKQNGQSTLDSLERQIRNAIDADSVSTNHIVLTLPAAETDVNEYLHVICVDESATNGWIGIVENTDPASEPLLSSYSKVTNDDLISGVSVTGCNIGVIQKTEGTKSPAIVQLSFILNQGVNAPSRVDFDANTTFQTTISLRQY